MVTNMLSFNNFTYLYQLNHNWLNDSNFQLFAVLFYIFFWITEYVYIMKQRLSWKCFMGEIRKFNINYLYVFTFIVVKENICWYQQTTISGLKLIVIWRKNFLSLKYRDLFVDVLCCHRCVCIFNSMIPCSLIVLKVTLLKKKQTAQFLVKVRQPRKWHSGKWIIIVFDHWIVWKR